MWFGILNLTMDLFGVHCIISKNLLMLSLWELPLIILRNNFVPHPISVESHLLILSFLVARDMVGVADRLTVVRKDKCQKLNYKTHLFYYFFLQSIQALTESNSKSHSIVCGITKFGYILDAQQIIKSSQLTI